MEEELKNRIEELKEDQMRAEPYTDRIEEKLYVLESLYKALYE